jgi:hypothetical protein
VCAWCPLRIVSVPSSLCSVGGNSLVLRLPPEGRKKEWPARASPPVGRGRCLRKSQGQPGRERRCRMRSSSRERGFRFRAVQAATIYRHTRTGQAGEIEDAMQFRSLRSEVAHAPHWPPRSAFWTCLTANGILDPASHGGAGSGMRDEGSEFESRRMGTWLAPRSANRGQGVQCVEGTTRSDCGGQRWPVVASGGVRSGKRTTRPIRDSGRLRVDLGREALDCFEISEFQRPGNGSANGHLICHARLTPVTP